VALIIKRPRTSQPRGAVGIDSAKTISAGTRFVINGASPYSNPVRRANHSLIGSGSGFSIGPSQKFLAIKTPNGGAARVDISEDWAGASTIDMLVYVRSVDASYGGIFSKNVSGTTSQLCLGRYDTSDTFYVGNSNSVTQFSGTSISSVVGRWACISVTLSGSGSSPTGAIYIDGKLAESLTMAAVAQNTGSGYLVLGSERAENASFDSDTDWAFFSYTNRVRSAVEIAALHANVWQLYTPRSIYIPLNIASSGVTGTLARTNANDTVVAAGNTTVTGTLSYTNINDNVAASGSTTITGTLARTNANDTSAASGSTTIIGTLARTNADDTVIASGSVGNITGTLATTNANDTVVASGVVPSVGTLAYTNNNDTSAASGSTTIVGTLAQTNANDTVAASGTAGTVSSVTIKAGSWIRYRIVT